MAPPSNNVTAADTCGGMTPSSLAIRFTIVACAEAERGSLVAEEVMYCVRLSESDA